MTSRSDRRRYERDARGEGSIVEVILMVVLVGLAVAGVVGMVMSLVG